MSDDIHMARATSDTLLVNACARRAFVQYATSSMWRLAPLAPLTLHSHTTSVSIDQTAAHPPERGFCPSSAQGMRARPLSTVYKARTRTVNVRRPRMETFWKGCVNVGQRGRGWRTAEDASGWGGVAAAAATAEKEE